MSLRRRRLLGVAALLLVCLVPRMGAAETDYERGKQSWLALQYRAAYDSLMVFRTQPGGRRPEVDYMLGTSGCRLTPLRTWGYRVLDWMLYAYPLTRSSRQLVAAERDVCRGAATVVAAARFDRDMLDPVVSAGMTARGKMFYFVEEGAPVASYPARRLRQMAPGTFEARLTPLEAGAEAGARVRQLVPGFTVASHSRFVLATSAGQSPAQLQQIAGQLDRFRAFLVRRYDVATPSHLLSVYLVADVGSLRRLAADIHGLDVSPATIGYTFRDDLSVVAVIPGTAIGTLFHELFHLVVRGNFGDIPQWLDEGIAGLYEVSSITGDEVRGEPNWRGRVLETLWGEHPSLETVITSGWFPFDVSEREQADPDSSTTARVAAHLATARYFALYLQERGKLADVYAAFRDLGLAELTGDVHAHALRLVERTLGQPIAAIDRDFEQWFRQVQRGERGRDATPGEMIEKYLPNQPAPGGATPGAPRGGIDIRQAPPLNIPDRGVIPNQGTRPDQGAIPNQGAVPIEGIRPATPNTPGTIPPAPPAQTPLRE